MLEMDGWIDPSARCEEEDRDESEIKRVFIGVISCVRDGALRSWGKLGGNM